ncbi:CPBP family intramembrane glutamic endopeptidase [Halopiger goleimassiliensis]|uniref:CPBP family intramembrane glutamic endopeptidase n=1 Tax=Halopiger goleimassiliensis TaxID=1293048 RepID=UPI0006783197|nr:type II CAAX endopeptidase family protein [Halopiger goleimassiliensis]
MPQWTAFAAITGVVLVLLLALSHLTQSAFPTDGDDSSDDASANDAIDTADETSGSDGTEPPSPFDDTPFESATGVDSSDRNSTIASSDDGAGTDAETTPTDEADCNDHDDDVPLETDRRELRPGDQSSEELAPDAMSTGMLLANVALSQGLFALVLLGGIVYTGIPADALGVAFSWAYLETGLLVGTGAGFVLYVANELGAALATRFGFDHDEGLRELLAPDTPRGWGVLLVGVLPIIAAFEELLFRAALVGAFSAGFEISPWLLAVVSSVAFALGHGMQGSVGVVVTGLLGFVLAGLFVVTGSFLVVVVAHYWINALEFLVHEGLDLEWAETVAN